MIHKSNLLECLRELADLRFQEQVWTGLVPGQMSSFPELVCQTFDDTGLTDATEAGVVRAELGDEIAALLERLDSTVGTVDASLPVEMLVVSEPMCEVRELAGLVVALLQDPQGHAKTPPSPLSTRPKP